MFTLFQWIGGGLKWLGGAIIKPLANLRQKRGIGRIVRCLVHALAVLLVLAGLWWVNYYFELDSVLRTPLPLLRQVWLPTLFGIGYALLWLGWYVCRSIVADDEPSPFPDIDRAWQEAVDAITRAGVDPARTPLYLLVGQPQGSVNDLIRSAGIPLVTPPVPPESQRPPMQVFANREAIYVSCAEVSLLGRQAQLFAGAPLLSDNAPPGATRGRPADAPPLSDDDVEPNDIPLEASLDEPPAGSSGGAGNRGGSTALADASTAVAATKHTNSAASAGLSLVEEQVAMLVEEYGASRLQDFQREFEATADLDPVTRDLAAVLLGDPEEAERITLRLRHLCHCIREQRHPYVPVHGILTLVPGAAGDCEAASHHVGELARRDLQSIHEVLQTRCPHVALICDLEQTPGCDALLDRFPADQRQRRLGVRFPELCESDARSRGETLDEGLAWLCDSLLTPLAYRLIEAPPESGSQRETLSGNLGLYRFLFRMRQRSARLAVTLRRLAAYDARHDGSLTGCYLVASGADSQREHGFAEAVFAQLPQLTGGLGWSAAALETDRRQRRLAVLGYVGLATVAASLTALMLLF